MWAGISWVGAIEIVLFEGMMNAEGYIDIVKTALLPFLQENLPTHHRLMLDNDPKRTSRAVRKFLHEVNVN